MKNTNIYQAYTYYMLSIVMLSVFALRSYTTVDQQPGYLVVLFIVMPFAIAAGCRPLLEHFLVVNVPQLLQARRQFLVDFGIYLSIAFALFFGELLLNEHSIVIAFKLFVLTLMVGYFASVDIALDKERHYYNTAKYEKYAVGVSNISVAQRLNLFFSVTILIALLACAFSAYSYMSLGEVKIDVKQAFIVDILFIIGIVISLTVRLIHSYSTNLRILFENQVRGLRNIQNGELENFIPVLSQDEFGIIAEQTNTVIEQLRDKREVEKTLEKIVSPGVKQKLMEADSQSLKVGQEIDVAILFCDLRKFTSYTESTPSEEVIYFLNAYFTKVADIVAEHNGIINKFMGDAILAVYGIEDGGDYIDDAMKTAWDLVLHSSTLKMRDGTTFDIGIGLHRGKATACTIGSSDRYEYTFIGDTVNIASRMDGLSKELGHKIITSEDVYKDLSRECQSRFSDLGMQAIRGKKSMLHIYGAEAKVGAFDDNVIPITALGGNRS